MTKLRLTVVKSDLRLPSIFRSIRQMQKRLRSWLPGIVVITLAGVTVVTVIWLHSAARSSPDAWPTSVAAGTTAALALITLWYAYLTHRLLEAQRSGPRIAGWETASRELSVYLNRQRSTLIAMSGIFPLGRPDAEPPDLSVLIETVEVLRSTREHLLEIVGILPQIFISEAFTLALHLTDAEFEIHALLTAMTTAQKEALDNGQNSWSWDEVRSAHETRPSKEQYESWPDVAQGRYYQIAEEKLEDTSAKIDRYLIGL
jgi:hypothetical protein